MEMTGFEPAASYMQSKRSTTELHPLMQHSRFQSFPGIYAPVQWMALTTLKPNFQCRKRNEDGWKKNRACWSARPVALTACELVVAFWIITLVCSKMWHLSDCVSSLKAAQNVILDRDETRTHIDESKRPYKASRRPDRAFYAQMRFKRSARAPQTHRCSSTGHLLVQKLNHNDSKRIYLVQKLHS